MTDGAVFVLVGHCWADRLGLKSAVKRAVPGARVEKANDMRALRAHLDRHAVLLVNRVLDGGFETGSGVDLIRHLAATGDAPAAVLISDHADAQVDAEVAGALPGFGKSQLRDETALDRLRRAAER